MPEKRIIAKIEKTRYNILALILSLFETYIHILFVPHNSFSRLFCFGNFVGWRDGLNMFHYIYNLNVKQKKL